MSISIIIARAAQINLPSAFFPLEMSARAIGKCTCIIYVESSAGVHVNFYVATFDDISKC